MTKTSKKADEFKHGELREIVLATLGASVLIGGTLITPNFPIVLGSIIGMIKEFRKKDIPEKKIKRVLQNLEKKEILSLEMKGNDVYVHLKDWLQPTIVKYSLRQILELKRRERKWNGKWFMVMFDVPESQRNKRVYLRSFLKDIGFFQYQKSVYLFPYECEKEIALIKKIIESGKYMSYIIAEKIENEKKAKIYFHLETIPS
ncbi:CRISPR-associated endonuclease Cas2 [Candidatus Roizmanbacteria bacterium RIFCSPHIGHO2_01_FULL_39_8]|uniref:CRISPR-associated endonuclease Cas2 n=1 Tax=Candidatus Roizmanbacteria bacterium RIFCSPHIGHO2_01_FULL_39_8 TaxID=1802033 RepID=A0A1F7GJP3_9BACT|nr:MAG: CRISPR-associated endonuclease Cas2 [Candidatus Roizmanbacteria bacterium RIFCSPHIGHO2_01_FULL_39_8]